MCVAFLSKPSMCLAVGEKMTAAGRTVGDCVCSDKDGRTINLLPLQRTDGQPRFVKLSICPFTSIQLLPTFPVLFTKMGVMSLET